MRVQLCGLAALLLLALPAAAQTSPDARLRDQLRETTTQLRQLQDENSGLKAANESLRKQLGDGAAAAPRASAEAPVAAALKLQLKQAQQQRAQLEQQLAAANTALAALKQSESALQQQLAQSQSGQQQMQQGLQQNARELQDCRADNQQLVQIGEELIARYRDKGLLASVGDREPLLGVFAVPFQTLRQQYQGRIVDATQAAPAP